MFMGEYSHTVDAKGRLIVPSKFREQLGDEFVVTKGLDGCLFVYPNEEWKSIEEKFRSLPLTIKDARDFSRFFFAGAAACEVDKQGRILLPAVLRNFAAIQKDVVSVGVLNRVRQGDVTHGHAGAGGNIDFIIRGYAVRNNLIVIDKTEDLWDVDDPDCHRAGAAVAPQIVGDVVVCRDTACLAVQVGERGTRFGDLVVADIQILVAQSFEIIVKGARADKVTLRQIQVVVHSGAIVVHHSQEILCGRMFAGKHGSVGNGKPHAANRNEDDGNRNFGVLLADDPDLSAGSDGTVPECMQCLLHGNRGVVWKVLIIDKFRAAIHAELVFRRIFLTAIRTKHNTLTSFEYLLTHFLKNKRTHWNVLALLYNAAFPCVNKKSKVLALFCPQKKLCRIKGSHSAERLSGWGIRGCNVV